MTEKIKHKCECDKNSMNNPWSKSMYSPEEYIAMKHLPNECKGTYKLTKYIRDGKEVWLCSACC